MKLRPLTLLAGALVVVVSCETEELTKIPLSFTVEPRILDFGGVPIGLVVSDRIRFHNSGVIPVDADLSIAGEDPALFTLDSDRMSVPEATAADIVVSFAPVQTGLFKGTLLLTPDDDRYEEAEVALLGQGVDNTQCGDCNSPPAPSCIGLAELLVWVEQGTCEDGQCRYTSVVVECEEYCDPDVNRCVQEQCGDCNNPPPPECVSSSQRRVWEEQGTCVDGTCRYVESREVCEGDTTCDPETGGCVATTCGPCTTPPSAAGECISESELAVWVVPGTCVDGQCQYTRSITICEDGCDPATDQCVAALCQRPPLPSDPCGGATMLSGGLIQTDTVWSGKYCVESSMLVAAGARLTIQPGSEIRFGASAMLKTEGHIEAVGTIDSPILFSASSAAGWYGIDVQLSPGGTIALQHAVVERAEFGLGQWEYSSDPSVAGPVADVTVRQVLFQFNSTAIITDDNTQLTQSTIACNRAGIWVASEDAPLERIINNNICFNEVWGISARQDSADATGNWWCTTEAAEIQAAIHDQVSDITMAGIIVFEPFRTGPVPEAPPVPTP